MFRSNLLLAAVAAAAIAMVPLTADAHSGKSNGSGARMSHSFSHSAVHFNNRGGFNRHAGRNFRGHGGRFYGGYGYYDDYCNPVIWQLTGQCIPGGY